jgi:glycosyltransferase involved in cell wall biosynthesis
VLFGHSRGGTIAEHLGRRPLRLVGGVTAYNEERRIESSLRSLLQQELPDGMEWTAVYVVASGCTDRTVAIVEKLAEADPRIVLVEERERNGKATALNQIFRRADGDFLLLLDGDSAVAPGAVKSLWAATTGVPPPFAVMGRPAPPSVPTGQIYPEVQLLYQLHHEFHAEMLLRGEGTHLADNLMFLSLGGSPTLPPSLVNDGPFLAHWVLVRGGRLLYAPGAEVILKIPLTLRDHLAQRRRIHWGHWQVRELTGIEVTTLETHARTRPWAAWRIVTRSVRASRKGVQSFLVLLVAEGLALALAFWDRVPPRHEHAIWVPIRDGLATPVRTPASDGRTLPLGTPSDPA